MTEGKNASRCFVASTCMFIAGLSLLCWDVYMRFDANAPLMDGDRLGVMEDSSNVYAISDSTPAQPTTSTAAIVVTKESNIRDNDGHMEREKTTQSGSQCLTFEETFDDLVASSSTVFITMPAKAAGTSLEDFTTACVGPYVVGKGENKNFLNSPSVIEKSFYANLRPPSILASHVGNDLPMIRLMRNAPHQSLVLYIHRDENDRLISAIRHVVETDICIQNHLSDKINVTIDGSRCVVKEKEFVESVIKHQRFEISLGASNIMTCEFYDSIQQSSAPFVFVHYKQADRLQKVLAHYHCPDLMEHNQLFHDNVATEKKMESFVKLEIDGREVTLDDWLDAKRDMIEFTFELRSGQTCGGKTMTMQNDLFGCKDELLQVNRDTSF